MLKLLRSAGGTCPPAYEADDGSVRPSQKGREELGTASLLRPEDTPGRLNESVRESAKSTYANAGCSSGRGGGERAVRCFVLSLLPDRTGDSDLCLDVKFMPLGARFGRSVGSGNSHFDVIMSFATQYHTYFALGGLTSATHRATFIALNAPHSASQASRPRPRILLPSSTVDFVSSGPSFTTLRAFCLATRLDSM